MDPFQTFSAGDKLKISADYHTLTVKMLQWWMNTQRGDVKSAKMPKSREMRPRIKNVSGGILAQYAIVAYQNLVGDKLVFPANADTYSFGDIVKESQVPAVGVPFAILQEPAIDDGLAVVKVSGDSLVLVSMATSADAYAGPIAADYAKLLGDTISGPARILDHRAPDAWSAVTAYIIGDTVSKSGTYYTATADNTNQTPPNASYWTARATCWAFVRLADPTGEHDTYFALSSTTITARVGPKLGKGVAILLTLIPDGGDEDWTPTTQTVTVYNACTQIAANTFLQLFREPISGKLMAVPLCVDADENNCPCVDFVACYTTSFPGLTDDFCSACDLLHGSILLGPWYPPGVCAAISERIAVCLPGEASVGTQYFQVTFIYDTDTDTWIVEVIDPDSEVVWARYTADAAEWDCNSDIELAGGAVFVGATPPCDDWPATITVSPCGSGSGGDASCCDGVCEDGDVSSTLTATVTAKVGCFTDFPDTITYTCADDGIGGHTWDADSTFTACGHVNPGGIACSLNGGELEPAFVWTNPANVVQTTFPDAGFVCYPFAAVYHCDDGAGNTATVTVTG